jgi:serine/threonine-protein kinase RsbW
MQHNEDAMSVQADLIIDSRLEELDRARQWVSGHARSEGFAPKAVFDLALVLSEVCTNVIKHAYRGEPNLPIELKLAIDETKLTLSVHDHGAKFDIHAYQPPDLSQPRESGYGVFIIRSLMDEVEYDTSGDRGTTVILVKYR